MNTGWGAGGKVDATLAYKCPTCGAAERFVCVYVAPPEAAASNKAWLKRLADRAGKPTRVPHQARYRAMHDYQGTKSQIEIARDKAKHRKARMNKEAKAIARLFAVRDAMLAQDRRDQVELHDWLKHHGHILCT